MMGSKWAALALLLVAVSGCKATAPPAMTWVVGSTHERQCENFSGISLNQSRDALLEAGVEIASSVCGKQTGIAVPAVCGGPKLDIYLHQIATDDLDKATAVNFSPASTLRRPDGTIGYRVVDCRP